MVDLAQISSVKSSGTLGTLLTWSNGYFGPKNLVIVPAANSTTLVLLHPRIAAADLNEVLQLQIAILYY